MTHAVVLNYRTPRETIRAIRSLEVSTAPPVTIHVVDNGSDDGSISHLRSEAPGADLIASASNVGFAAGCNLGIAAALRQGAHRVLLLNSDATLAPDSLETMVRVLDDEAEVGIVGPAILSADGTRVESLGIDYGMRTGRMRCRGYGSRWTGADCAGLDGSGTTIAEVAGVSGAAMLVRRGVFEKIGLLAEEFFFGFEDLDFCLRARRAGYRSVCVGAATARHDGHASIGRGSARRVYFGVRNHLLLAQRMGPATMLGSASILLLNLAYAITTRDVRTGAGLAAYGRGVRDYARGTFGGPPDPPR